MGEMPSGAQATFCVMVAGLINNRQYACVKACDRVEALCSHRGYITRNEEGPPSDKPKRVPRNDNAQFSHSRGATESIALSARPKADLPRQISQGVALPFALVVKGCGSE